MTTRKIHLLIHTFEPRQMYATCSLFVLLAALNSTLDTGPSCYMKKNLPIIKMAFGDRIWCHSNPFNPVFHVMLATSNNSIIHVIGSQSTHKAEIKEQTREEFMNTGYAEEYCENQGVGPLGAEVSVQRAREWTNVTTYYDLFRCNCQHYLNYWTTGSSGRSFNSLMKTNEKCAIK